MGSRYDKIQLSDGTVLLIEGSLGEVGETDEIVEASSASSIHDAQDFFRGIEGIAKAMRESIEAVQPNSTQLEIHLGARVEGGKLLAMLCKGSASATVKVILKWE